MLVEKQRLEREADVSSRDYTLRAQPGENGERDTHSGISVGKLLTIAGFDPGEIGFLTVPRPDGTTALLPSSDLANPPPFPDGPPLVWVDVASTHFFRPVRNDSDANAPDNIATVSGAPLAMGLHAGNLLSVSARASGGRARTRRPVGFSAEVRGQGPGEELTYQWHFGDGASGAGPLTGHRYRRIGSYRAFVTVTGNRDSGGESPPLVVTVGKPPKNGHNGAGSSKSAEHGSATGTGRGNGAGTGSGGSAVGANQSEPTAAPSQLKRSTRTETRASGPLRAISGLAISGFSRPVRPVSGAALLHSLSDGHAGGLSSSVGSASATSSGSASAAAWSVLGLSVLVAAGVGWENQRRQRRWLT